MLCHGEGCLVTFSNVHFEETLVVALDGAKDLFQDCTFRLSNKAASYCTCAVFVHGQGTRISMLQSEVNCGSVLRTGIMVQAGASAVLETCACRGAIHTAIEVHGTNSTVNCKDMTVQGPELDYYLSVGILAHKGAYLRASRMTVCCVAAGVIVVLMQC